MGTSLKGQTGRADGYTLEGKELEICIKNQPRRKARLLQNDVVLHVKPLGANVFRLLLYSAVVMEAIGSCRCDGGEAENLEATI